MTAPSFSAQFKGAHRPTLANRVMRDTWRHPVLTQAAATFPHFSATSRVFTFQWGIPPTMSPRLVKEESRDLDWRFASPTRIVPTLDSPVPAFGG